MTERTPRTATAIALTMRCLIAVGAVALVASAFACAAKTGPVKTEPAGGSKQAQPTGEEPPIRVRNGSMDVGLTDPAFAWLADGDAWTPSKGSHSGTFEVKVASAGGHTCGQQGPKSSGKNVSVFYSNGTEVTFRISNNKTKVRPKDTLAKVSDQLLRLGREGDSGFITKVAVKDGQTNWECGFGKRADLDAITICPSSHPLCR
jgi:hypothetical protein